MNKKAIYRTLVFAAAFICSLAILSLAVSAEEIERAANYHDGVVWAELKETDNSSRWCAVDPDGNILFRLGEEELPATCFCNGVSIIDYQYVVNKSGEVVWSIEEDGWSYANEQWGEGVVEEIHLVNNWKSSIDGSVINDPVANMEEDFFGYPQVEFLVNTFDYTGYYTGFLNPDGTWRREPVTMKAEVCDGEYGVYRMYFSYDTWKEGAYRIETDEIADTDQMEKDVYYKTRGRWGAEYYANLHDGLIFVAAGALGNQIYDGLDLESYDVGFYDLNSDMQISLGQYHLAASPYPAFKDGYALMQLENDQKSPFYTLMDKNGEFVFEPRKKGIYPFDLSDTVHENMYWVREENGEVTYYNTAGDPAFQAEQVITEARDFYDGRASVKTENGWHFIDTSGAIVW